MWKKRRAASELLLQAEAGMKDSLRPYFLEIGLTVGQGQPRILRSLLKKDHVTQKELAKSCFLDVTTMSRTLDKLEAQGYLVRERDENCRRSFRIVLTDEGRVKAEEVQEGLFRLDETAWEGFEEREIRELEGYLRRLLENMRKAGKEP